MINWEEREKIIERMEKRIRMKRTIWKNRFMKMLENGEAPGENTLKIWGKEEIPKNKSVKEYFIEWIENRHPLSFFPIECYKNDKYECCFVITLKEIFSILIKEDILIFL